MTEATAKAAELYTEQRPWGSFTVLMDANDCKVKRISVNPGGRLSLQLHHKREEHWIVVSGHGEVTVGDATTPCGPGRYIHIPTEAQHRIFNSGSEPLDFVEVQLGSYFGEDDIVRFQDDYNRVNG